MNTIKIYNLYGHETWSAMLREENKQKEQGDDEAMWA